MAVLTDGLKNLQRQLDAAFPDRHRPDGWLGDAAHRARTSGHNPDDSAGSRPAWNGDGDSKAEVRALDVSADLGDGVDSLDVVKHLIKLPNFKTVVRYVIHRGHIYHADNGFKADDYDGDNPHTKHVHFEGAWTQAADNNTTYNFHLEDVPVALNAADKAYISSLINASEARIKADTAGRFSSFAASFLDIKIGDPSNPNRSIRDLLKDIAVLRGFLVAADDYKGGVSATSPVGRLVAFLVSVGK